MVNNSYFRNAIILGLITAVGPFAVDMYLPTLPNIGTDLGVAPETVVLTLTSYFLAFGVFQMVFGTAADVWGRKAPLYAGIGLFIAAGIGCALATSIETLIVLRFLQGIGGAAGIIVPRAIVRDMYSGVEEVKLMSMLMLVFSVSPLLAPLGGSLLVDAGGWRTVFWVLTAVGIFGLVLLTFFVGETLPKEKRIKANAKDLKAAVSVLIKDRTFMGMIVAGAFSITAFFIYLGNSAFVLKTFYGFTPMQYSLAFSANALAFFAMAQANGFLAKKYGMHKLMIPSAVCFAVVMCAGAVLFHLGINSYAVMAIALFIGFSFVGILMPNIMVLALADHGAIAGTAASLMNTVQLMVGSVAMAIVSQIPSTTPVPMMDAIALAAILTLVFTFATFKAKK